MKKNTVYRFLRVSLTAAVMLSLLLSLMPVAVSAAGKEVVYSYDFTKLTNGEISADKIGACDSLNMMFGCDGVPLLSARNGYEAAYATWAAEAKPGDTIESLVLEFNGRNWFREGPDTAKNKFLVMLSNDNEDFATVKDYPFTANGDYNQLFQLDLTEYAAGETKVYVRLYCLVFDSPHVLGFRSVKITVNGNVEIEPEPEVIETSKKPTELQMVNDFYSFNNLDNGEVTPEQIGAVAEQNMAYGMDSVSLLSSRNGYEQAFATWKIRAAEGEPINDLVLTLVGRTWFMDEKVKPDNAVTILVSVDNHDYHEVTVLHSTDNSDEGQKFNFDLTEFVKGYGQAYVQLQFLVFDAPHIMGFRSLSLTANTQGISSGSEMANMAVSSTHSFTSLPVGEVKATDIGALKTGNLMFGYHNTPLLTPCESDEDAYAIWKITAAEGEKFEDCHLILVGKITATDPAKKDTTALKISVSADGEDYSSVKSLTPVEDDSDTQLYVIDLKNYTYGLTDVFVKLYWTSEDDPAGFGLRSMTLVGNCGKEYMAFVPDLEDRVISAADKEPKPVIAEKEPVFTALVVGLFISDGVFLLVVLLAVVCFVLDKKGVNVPLWSAIKNR